MERRRGYQTVEEPVRKTKLGASSLLAGLAAGNPDTARGHQFRASRQRQGSTGLGKERQSFVAHQVLIVLTENSALRNHNQRILGPVHKLGEVLRFDSYEHSRRLDGFSD